MTGSTAKKSFVAGLIVVAVAIWALPGCEPQLAMRPPSAQVNVMELGKAAIAYAVNHNDHLPPAHSWPQALTTEENLPESALVDPDNPAGGRMFAMNTKLSNVLLGAIRRPGETVLFFECAPGSPPAGGPEILPTKPRHGAGCIVSFADGHSEIVPPDHAKNLRWDP